MVRARLERVRQVWWRVKPYLLLLLGGLAVVALFILALIYVPKMQVPTGYWLHPKVIFDMENEARRTVAYIIGGILAVIGIALTFWRIRTLEKQVDAMEKQILVAQEGQITERFTRAIDQLGSGKMEIRLGGIYALERIAQDSEKDHWPIMEVFTTYVRENVPWSEPDEYEPIEDNDPNYKPRTDIQAILTVIGRRKEAFREKETRALNLSHTDLREMNLRESQLDRAGFTGANLNEARLVKASLQGANLSFARIDEARLNRANLEGADLWSAKLREAILVETNLKGARLWSANLREAILIGANLEGANLTGAWLQGVDFKGANLKDANFVGANLRDAKLEEANYLTINQVSKSRNLFGATLNAELRELVKKNYPHLLEKPPNGVEGKKEK